MGIENKGIEKERKRILEMWDEIKKLENEQIKKNKFLLLNALIHKIRLFFFNDFFKNLYM